MTSDRVDDDPTPRRRGLRLTSRVFWDLAVYMVGLGVGVGLVFPPFATALGVPASSAGRPLFRAACLGAGFLVGGLSYALCRWVVGGRLAVLCAHLRQVAHTITSASRTGDWSGALADRIAVDSDDQLGDAARAFNSLLDALEEGEHFRALVRNASDVISVVDADGRISYQTPSVGWVLGYPPAALLGTDLHELLHPDDVAAFREHLAGAVAGRPDSSAVGTRMRHRNGSWRWVETVANNLLADPAVNGVVLTTRDVSDRKELEEKLRTQAFYDALTGLPNRALFLDRLREAELVGRQTGAPAAVLFLDLDNLKAVNDNLGHEGGDDLLRALTERLTRCVRPGDTVARLSGDEFAVLLVGPHSGEDAERVADRLLETLRAPVAVGDHLVRTGVSIGLATSATCAASEIGLLRAADMAMYVAKTSGKSRCEVFQPAHHAARLQRDELRAALHEALDGGQLELHYQPIVDVVSSDIAGFEALLRWRHPERGLVPPLEFIGLAEETGLIVPIGRWVLQEATRQAARWQPLAPTGRLRMSVNVSVRQFQHPDLVRDVRDALRRSGLDPQLLTLEITESLLVADTDGTARKLQEIRELGVRLALDDFGTGYSSLSYLRRFPIDTLKIDKSFVDGVLGSSEGHAVVAAITSLGQTLRLEVVAEGLETAEQVEALSRLGCPLGQGYHFARPLPPQEAAGLLGAGRGPVSSLVPA
jgi:diguanylate cyclase (GGDEF)-like protein/PAS domain S-box-containing protein